MKTVNMALDKKELKEDRASMAGTGPQNKFPYGLCIYLDDDMCQKLDLTKGLPAGTIVKFEGSAIVESSGERIDRDGDEKGDKEITMSLQITDLGVEPEGTATHPAELLYTNS